MANYSIKNFLPGPFPLKCHLVGAKSLSASFDSAPSEPSFHQDTPQTLTGAVSANRSLWIPPSLSPFSPKPRDEACGERPWWLWIPRRPPPGRHRGSAPPGTRAARLIYRFVGQNQDPSPGPGALGTQRRGGQNTAASADGSSACRELGLLQASVSRMTLALGPVRILLLVFPGKGGRSTCTQTLGCTRVGTRFGGTCWSDPGNEHPPPPWEVPARLRVRHSAGSGGPSPGSDV